MTTNDASTPLSGPTPPRCEPIAIIGIGCLFPKADSPGGFWVNIRRGTDAITDIPPTHWSPEDYFAADPSAPDRTYGRRGGFLDPVEFNPRDYGISPNNIEATDTTQLLGLVAARAALLDAGYATSRDAPDGKPFDRDRTSVILGVTGALELVIPLGARLGHPVWRRALEEAGVEKSIADEVVQRIAGSYVPWQENSFPGLLGNVTAGRIANRFDLGGTNCVVDAACASSLSAIHLAALELRSGRADMVLTGGIDTFSDIFMYMCFSKTPALSPAGDSRPFSADGDGTILGEGVGVIVLKRLADARRDGDRIYAVIRGIGSSSDGRGNAIYAPSAAGQRKALLRAYGEADVRPRTIELLEAHGTGTKVGDAVEAEALCEVYRADREDGTWCALGSVKSMIGHTKAAAGVAGLIKAALALDRKVLPPTIKVERPLESLLPGKAPLYVNTSARPWLSRREHPRRAGLSAFGFGGSNFHCVIEEAKAVKDGADWSADVQVLPFSAASIEALDGALGKFEEALGDPSQASWAHFRAGAAALRRRFDPREAFRLVLAADRGRMDIPRALAGARGRLKESSGSGGWSTPDGIFFGTGARAGRLAVLFPGQGSQYPGMLRDLACTFPEVLDSLSLADDAFGETEQGSRLSDRIYPAQAFGDDARAAAEVALRDTRTAQPAICAVSAGLFRVLQGFGLRPEAAAGHSFGELVALWAAGRIDERALHTLAALRGKLMAEVPAGADRGAMLAVSAPLVDVERLLREEGLDLVIANRNSPSQAVLSGSTGEIERAGEALARRGARTNRLQVSAAFHGPLVASAARPFRADLERFGFEPGGIPVFSNTTASPYPDDPAETRRILAGQLAAPVDFLGEVEALHAGGFRLFVEVGPGSKLTGLVRSILDGREHQAIAVDASSGKRSGHLDLALAIAEVAALGHPVDLGCWDPDPTPAAEPARPGLTVRISGANHVKPRDRLPPRPRTAAVSDPVPVAVPESAAASGSDSVPVLVPVPVPAPAPDSASVSTPVPDSSPPAYPPSDHWLRALEITQQSLHMLQKMQEETSRIHRQFLEGHAEAQRSVRSLVESQERLLTTTFGLPASPPPALSSPPVLEAPPLPAVAAPEPAALAPAMPIAANAVAPPARQPAPLAAVLLAIVAEKTGYPLDTLELDMSLDADLGIDSIKRVEILSAVQDRLPAAPAVKPEDMGRLQTLRQIVAFLDEGLAAAADGGALPGHAPAPAAVSPRTVETLAPVATPPAAGRAASSEKVLLAIVAEKTGYPLDTLELDMSLDADLGIDSIKRVEILSTVQDRLPGAPAVKPEDMGRLETLRQIVAFLDEGGSGAGAGAGAVSEAETETGAGTGAVSRAMSVLDRRVPTARPLVLPRTLLALARDCRIWISDDGAGLAGAISVELKARGLEASVVDWDASPGNEPLGALLVLAPLEPASSLPVDALKLIQRCAPALRRTGKRGGALLASVSRLDGAFGFSGGRVHDPLSGALAGIVKTAGCEWTGVSVRAIDLAAERAERPDAAARIADVLLCDGPLEIGIAAGGFVEVDLEPSPLPPDVEQASGPGPVGPADVVVITGGARGVTAEVALELAKAWRPTLLLLGRSAEPAPEPAWMAGLTGEAEIKRAIAANVLTHDPARSGAATPRAVEEHYRRVVANRELLVNLRRIERAGSRAIYRSVDARDAREVSRAIAWARERIGPIRGIVHGAGVIADRLIEDKTPEQFQQVFTTKVEGLRALLAATETDDLRLLVLFSSSTARFGRRGQVDYAAANEMLNKMAHAEARRRPDTRVLSLNWGPWDGGMVTPQLRKLFESEGVAVIPIMEGARHVVRELVASPGGPVEVVVLGPKTAARPREPLAGRAGPSASAAAGLHLAFERELTADGYPFLLSHVLNGRAVLPTAIIAEWLAHGAMHDNPGLFFHGFDDLRILKGVTLEQDARVKVQVLAARSSSEDGREVVPVELRGGDTTHARARIILASWPPEEPSPRPQIETPAGLRAYAPAGGEVYADGRLFHGPDLQGIEAVEGCSERGIVAVVKAAPPPAAWMKQPLRSAWIADPLALDSSFQLMILWSFEARGVGSLPTRAARYRQFRSRFPADGSRVIVRVERASDHSAEARIDFLDRRGALVARLDGYECVLDPSLANAFARNQLAEKVG